MTLTKLLMSQEQAAVRWRLALGEYLRTARELADLTQTELADVLGLHNKQFVSSMETGHNSVPSDHLATYADAVKVDRAEFARMVLRYEDPWMYAALFGADAKLKHELQHTSASWPNQSRAAA